MSETLSHTLEIEICIDGKTFSWVVRNKLLACFMQDFWLLLINMKQWSFSNSFTGSFLNNIVLCKLWELIENFDTTLFRLWWINKQTFTVIWLRFFFKALNYLFFVPASYLLRPNEVFYSVISYHKIFLKVFFWVENVRKRR